MGQYLAKVLADVETRVGHKFDEQDSLDFEWDRMIEGFAEKATPDLCLNWISIIGKERKVLETCQCIELPLF